MRAVSFAAFIVGVCLIPTALGVAKLDHDRVKSQLERSLVAETEEHGGELDNYFARSRAIILLTANSPAFANVLAEPGTRGKGRTAGPEHREVTQQLGYLEQLYPSGIGETCFIDSKGEEFARRVRGEVAPPSDLSTTEKTTVFFAPTFALKFGQVHQTEPYVSPDTREWVVANASLIPQADGRKRAFAHFEVTIESFRRAMGKPAGYELRVIDGKTGKVVIDGGDSATRRRTARGPGRPRASGRSPAMAAARASPRSVAGRPRTAGSCPRPATRTTGSWSHSADRPDRQLHLDHQARTHRHDRDRPADRRARGLLPSRRPARARGARQHG